MKKIIYLIGVIILSVSCSKNKDKGSAEKMSVTGKWLHLNEVPMGTGKMSIASEWSILDDGTANLRIDTHLNVEGNKINKNVVEHTGKWKLVDSTITVTIPDHEDSPFSLTLSSPNQMSSPKGATWVRKNEIR